MGQTWTAPPENPQILPLTKVTKICAVTLMLISLSVSTIFAQPGQIPDRTAQKPDDTSPNRKQRQATNYRTEERTAEILAALVEKITRLEKQQDELSKQVDNLQHRLDELTTKH